MLHTNQLSPVSSPLKKVDIIIFGQILWECSLLQNTAAKQKDQAVHDASSILHLIGSQHGIV